MQSSTLQWSQFCHISHRTGSASNAESSVLQYHRAGSALNADSFTLQRSQFCAISPHRANRASNAERFTLQRSQFCAISPHRAGKVACQSFTLRSQFFVSAVSVLRYFLFGQIARQMQRILHCSGLSYVCILSQRSQFCDISPLGRERVKYRKFYIAEVSVLRYFPPSGR